ncbi:MAG TPA: hypothetical protein ENN72_06475 [Firmicutes bacterium]|nr:hypothetical protein [Bacillota bacterium]
MKRTIIVIVLFSLLIFQGSALDFREYLRKAYEKGDGGRDLELADRYAAWSYRSDFSAILPQIDFEFYLPSYSNAIERYEGLGVEYENEYLFYGGRAILNQVLPTNTEIQTVFHYSDYTTYQSGDAEIDGGFATGRLTLTVRQYLWGSNAGFHRLKRWLNSRRESEIKRDQNVLNFLRSAYENYLDYLSLLRNYELNKGQTERYRDIFKATENSYKMGLTDLITYNRIKKRHVFLEMALKEAEMQLKEADKKMELYLNEPFEDPEKKIINISYDLFRECSPQAKTDSQKILLDNALRNYKLKRRAYEPALFGELEATYSAEGASSPGPLERDRYTASLVLSIPFANLSKVAGLKMEKINYLQEKNRYEDEKEIVGISFEKLMTQLDIYKEKIELFQVILPTLAENYRSSLSRFHIGAITLQELMDIEDEYISSELEYLNLLKYYNLTALEISSYVGNSNEIMEELL